MKTFAEILESKKEFLSEATNGVTIDVDEITRYASQDGQKLHKIIFDIAKANNWALVGGKIIMSGHRGDMFIIPYANENGGSQKYLVDGEHLKNIVKIAGKYLASLETTAKRHNLRLMIP